MTVEALERHPADAPTGRVPLFLKLALRELRNGLGSFVIFVVCIALGVAAIAGVGALAGGLKQSLVAQGQAILGADMAASLIHRRATDAERKFFAAHGVVSEIATLRTMARPAEGERAVLVQVKAADKRYPLYGDLVARDAEDRPLDAQHLSTVGAAFVEELLLTRLELGLGDTIRVGDGDLRIVGLLKTEPDQLSGRPAFGPRVLMSLETLGTTGLIQPGSLMRWHYRVRLGGDANTVTERLEGIKKSIKAIFPDAGFSVRTRADPNPNLRRGIERFAQFLTLIGLATLVIGGIGVANAIATYLARKRDVIAAFKCLGASATTIFWTYLTQILVLASIGILIGLAVSAFVPPLVAWAYADVLPLEISLEPTIGPLALAALYGFLTALLFAFWPLGQARDVSPTLLLRQPVTGQVSRPRWSFILASAAMAVALVTVAILSAELKKTRRFCLARPDRCLRDLFAARLGDTAPGPPIAATPQGGVGPGPREYRQPDRLGAACRLVARYESCAPRHCRSGASQPDN